MPRAVANRTRVSHTAQVGRRNSSAPLLRAKCRARALAIVANITTGNSAAAAASSPTLAASAGSEVHANLLSVVTYARNPTGFAAPGVHIP